ncbi:MAG: organic solvent tolerance ABC transporter substrate-binding protein [Nitrospiraceae bacterium]|nr:organic solvent tolerance ABC transporter substrate-binding protein [Nitrospiraceae bacterium]|tara:strand:- start:1742 stop:2404 length:663 start_codon:yes stop_codon:yes gene_type:complete
MPDRENMHMSSTTTHIYKRIFIIGCFVLGGYFSNASAAISPTQAIQETTNALLTVLTFSYPIDPELSPHEVATDRRTRLYDILVKRFDYREMARRTLAQHWKKRSADEKEEFISLLSKLLMSSYITTVESRTDSQVNYLDETIKGDFSQVKTQIINKSGTIPVEYRMREKNGKWRVYDVVIDGVSVVRNFRKQFDRIIRSKSFATLTSQLREKIAISPPP